MAPTTTDRQTEIYLFIIYNSTFRVIFSIIERNVKEYLLKNVNPHTSNYTNM